MKYKIQWKLIGRWIEWYVSRKEILTDKVLLDSYVTNMSQAVGDMRVVRVS